jgi:hypothetical protein
MLIRVPAVYLKSAEVSILAFLRFIEINNLRWLRMVAGFESRPAQQIKPLKKTIAVRFIPAFAVLVWVVVCQSPSLIVDDGNGKTAMHTAADLSKLPQHTINTAEHDTQATFEGVLLSNVRRRWTRHPAKNCGGN